MNTQSPQKLPNSAIAPLNPPQKDVRGWMILGHTSDPRLFLWIFASFVVAIFVLPSVIPIFLLLLQAISRAVITRLLLTPFMLRISIALVFSGVLWLVWWKTLQWIHQWSSSYGKKQYPIAGQIGLSDYPLRLGQRYTLFYSRELAARRPIAKPGKLTIELVCAEVVTYKQGTDTVHERQILHQETIHTQSILVGSSGAIEGNCYFSIPVRGIPSFEAEHNRIRWQLEAKEEFDGKKPWWFSGTVEYVLWVEP